MRARPEAAADAQFVAAAHAADNPPVVEAGFDRTVAVGDTVVLDGTGSRDPQTGKLLTFAWVIVAAPAGSTAALDDPARVKPSFTVDLAGDYVIELTATRQNQTSARDRVVISTVNSAPMADSGRDLEVTLGRCGGAAPDHPDRHRRPLHR